MMNRIFGLFLVVTAIVTGGPASADVVTYNVDVSAVDDGGSGNVVRVYGTLDVDADIADTASALQGYQLFLQVNSEGPVLLSELFNGGGTDIDFVDIDGSLYVQITNMNNQELVWQSPEFSETFFLGSGPSEGEVAAFAPGGFWERGIPDGNGFFLGTAIPEPSSALLLGLVSCGVLGGYRHRRPSDTEVC